MGEHLLTEVDKLYVSDLNPARAEQFKAEHEGNIECVPLETAYFTECDIVSPCAIGGILSDETIPKLNCKYVWGSSNNGLKASSTEEEIRLAEMLKARGIVFQVEWWHNTAGVICGHHEYMYGKNATQEALYADIDSKLPGSTYMNLKQADELGITPTENAYRLVNEVIYGDQTFEDLNW